MIEIQGIERVEMTQRIDQIRRRIAAIEEKIGMANLGGNFATTLEREIARQAKTVQPTQQTQPTQAAADTQRTQPVNENEAANAAKVAQALREADKTQAPPPKQEVKPAEPSKPHLPGEEALPERTPQPQQPPPKIERVEFPDTELEVPSRDDKVFEDTYLDADAELTTIDDFVMQTARQYGVDPQVVQGIVEYINQRQTQPAPLETDDSAEYAEPAAITSVEDLIVRTAHEYGVDPQLVKAIATAESNMNQDEISPVGAIGVMQLMPETAAGLGVDPYDTTDNIAGGTRYLKQMLDTFDGNVPLAVAAYNAGPGAVKRYGGIPPYSETKNYVGRVMDLYQ